LVVVAYGLILPGNILKLPIFGCLNIHPSLLPRWRGAAPIQRAIEAGDGVTGVCLIQMETGLDTGPIWKQEKVLIEVNDTYNTLENKLLDLSIKLLKNFLFERPFVLNCKPEKQMNDGLTIAAKISKQECKVNWNEKVNVIYNKIRAFNPYPGVYTYFGTFRVKLADPVLIELESTKSVPGTVMGLAKTKTGEKVLKITCGNGTLGIRRVKKEGGKWITARDYLNSIISKENIVFSS
jgi:methionyl-tRNA formyltransferase